MNKWMSVEVIGLFSYYSNLYFLPLSLLWNFQNMVSLQAHKGKSLQRVKPFPKLPLLSFSPQCIAFLCIYLTKYWTPSIYQILCKSQRFKDEQKRSCPPCVDILVGRWIDKGIISMQCGKYNDWGMIQ